MTKRKFGLSATALRWFALGCMLLDHLWGTIIPGNEWMTCLGRLAFPIFAFQVAEGYLHTHDFKNYSNRIMLCIILSEIPFDLMMFGTAFYPFHQNVMMTLWLGLMSIHTIDQVRKKETAAWLGCIKLIGLLLLGFITFPDYGLLGVLNVVVFYLLRDFPKARLAQLAAMIAIHGFGYGGRAFVFEIFGGTLEIPIQSFAVLSLIPIWLYQGEKGSRSKFIQYFSYAFYPLHMIVLYLIRNYLL